MNIANNPGTIKDNATLPSFLDDGVELAPIKPLSPPPTQKFEPPEIPLPKTAPPAELLRKRALVPPPPPPQQEAPIESAVETNQPVESLIAKLRRLITERRFGDIPPILKSDALTSDLLLEKDDKGKLLLHSVLLSGNILLFKEILESPKCTEEVLSGVDGDGNTVLHLAALADLYPQFTQMILSRVACTESVIAIRNNEKKTALHLACLTKLLDCMKVFLHEPKCNESAFFIGDANDNTALHYAVSEDKLDLFFQLLVSGRMSDRVLNKKNNKGVTAFYQAVDLSTIMNTALANKPVLDIEQANSRLKMVKGFAHLNNVTDKALEYKVFDGEKHEKSEEIGGYHVLEQMLLEGDQAKATTPEIKRELALLFIRLAREDLTLIANGLTLKNEKMLKPRIDNLCEVVMGLPLTRLSTKELIDVALLLKKCKEALQDPAKHLEEFNLMINKVRHINRSWAKVLVRALVAVVCAILCAAAFLFAASTLNIGTSLAVSKAVVGMISQWTNMLNNPLLVNFITGGAIPFTGVLSCASAFFAYRTASNGELGLCADKIKNEIKNKMV